MVQNAIQEWEIDPSKLIIKDAIICSNRGEVHHGIYDGKHVNVKLISWMRNHDDSYSTTGFMQEVAVWQNLDHPNVSKFVGATLSSSLLETVNNDEYGYSDRRLRKDCCVVEEYLPAGDLRSYIDENREKKLSLKVVIRLALDVSTGLSYLHSLNIVHRNIKPENLLLDKAHRVKISEFGVARIADTYPSHMTQLDETSNYTAPEVLSRAPYNRKCDVYSFGICLWEIYCCDWPYPNHVDWQLREAVVQQNLRPEIPECCPSSLANVMTRCWDANPDNRPEMQEVLSLLMAIDISKGRGMIPCEPSHEGSPAYPTEKKSRGWSFFRMFCGS